MNRRAKKKRKSKQKKKGKGWHSQSEKREGARWLAGMQAYNDVPSQKATSTSSGQTSMFLGATDLLSKQGAGRSFSLALGDVLLWGWLLALAFPLALPLPLPLPLLLASTLLLGVGSARAS